MSDVIARDILLDLLRNWESGVFDETRVHAAAESLWEAAGDWPTYPKGDARSIAIEVLSNLDTMNVGFIGREDIPAMRAFLETSPGDEIDAWKTWDAYWAKVDFDVREQLLGADGYYRNA